uniref:Uncharacterized protein n=1 Tax=Anguilla anguilla TaxID=7936 RepID=A0A0E9V3C2_ANGAN
MLKDAEQWRSWSGSLSYGTVPVNLNQQHTEFTQTNMSKLG